MIAPAWLKDLRFQIFYYLVTKAHAGLITLGQACPWTVDANSLGRNSHVLSAGAGNDISFEKALIVSCGCKIVLLDPSPTGLATVQKENLPPESLKFMPIGLAGLDGVVDFEQPRDPNEGSFVGGGNSNLSSHQFRCQTPSTLMLELGWSQIDLLKIDIEGLEYEVIQHILKNQVKVRQICVEFHHGGGFRHKRKDTIGAVLALRRAGYDLIHRNSWDHTFIRRTD
jgi:FkbM family methyltransferase